MSKPVELDRIDLVVEYAIVHAYLDEIKARTGGSNRLSKEDARRSVRTFGIVKVWGGDSRPMMDTHTGSPLMWAEGPNGNPSEIPGGVVNQFIISHGLGRPLFHSNQFYRIADKLEQAGWLLGGETRFMPSHTAEVYVTTHLDPIPPTRWPYRLSVQNGLVVSTSVPSHTV